jgi:spore maturation protein CgeB
MSGFAPTDGSRGLLLIGNPDVFHVGAHLRRAAASLGLEVSFCDVRDAFAGPGWYAKLNWRLRGHRPPRLREFSRAVIEVCRAVHPRWLLSTGLAPVDSTALAEIGQLDVRRLNFLTDDPWNPAHRAPWFLQALPRYDQVFSPRRANLQDLVGGGCRIVSYLPFAYAPDLHYPEQPKTELERRRLESDVVFAGGADPDRLPVISALIQAGYDIGLYGGYWERFGETRRHCRGHANPETLRKAISSAKVALGLVRRANRDGHAMRTFEVTATGACMLVEDTPEHRELFGEDGAAVAYFDAIPAMLDKLRWLLDHEEDRRRMATAARSLVVGGQNTYADRLATMLEVDLPSRPRGRGALSS